jgi:hypothetical protein
MSACLKTLIPTSSSFIMPFTLATAFETPLPRICSCRRHEVPRPRMRPLRHPRALRRCRLCRFSRITSASTVGLPLESIISLALTFAIDVPAIKSTPFYFSLYIIYFLFLLKYVRTGSAFCTVSVKQPPEQKIKGRNANRRKKDVCLPSAFIIK